MDEKTVEEFYNKFDFEEFLTKPPKLIEDYLDGEINFLKETIQFGSQVLEVGCVYGRLLNIFSQKAEKVVGIDYSKKLLEKARQNLAKENIELKFMNAKKLDFEDNTFDYVVCANSTLGNMPGIELDVLKEMFRVCKKGGMLIISVFSENAKDVQIKNYLRIGLKNPINVGNAVLTDDGFYSRRFTVDDLKVLFKAVRLKPKIIDVCSINHVAYAIK